MFKKISRNLFIVIGTAAIIYTVADLTKAKPATESKDTLVPGRDYQIEVDQNGLSLWDASRYVGFIKWAGKETPLDSLIFEDNK